MANIHFIGSEGVSMKMLAAISRQNGNKTSGSDISTGGHDSKNVEGADMVVYSAAIKEDNPELLRAKELGIKILTRAEMLGNLCEDYGLSLAVAGSHGKTTTTAMLWQILAPQNPTVHIGGSYNGQIGRLGGRGLFITEACEYKRSFLSLKPDIAIVLNTDLDHTDCYPDIEDVHCAFREFANGAKRLVIYNGDESFCPVVAHMCKPQDLQGALGEQNPNDVQNTICAYAQRCGGKMHQSADCKGNMHADEYRKGKNYSSREYKGKDCAGSKEHNKSGQCAKEYIKVGLGVDNDYYATCLMPDKKGRYSFCVFRRSQRLGRVSLSVAGRHNVYNALFAVAACINMGLSFGRISAGLSMFSGAERRMEFLGYREGCAVFSDYAHHPKEIESSLISAKESCYRHLTVVFEPHTYTRTRSFLDGFVEALSIADRVVLLPIYAARETPIEGVDSRLIADGLKNREKDALCLGNYDEAKTYLRANLKDDGILLFMGAGTVDKLAREFLKPTL